MNYTRFKRRALAVSIISALTVAPVALEQDQDSEQAEAENVI